MRNEFLGNLDTLNSKHFISKAPNHGERSSVPLKYTVVAIYTAIPKINSRYDTVNPLEIYFYLLMNLLFFDVFLQFQ